MLTHRQRVPPPACSKSTSPVSRSEYNCISADGRTTYRHMNGRPGVYLIKEDNAIVYIGFSAQNLYRTLYRHFQHWNHPAQEVVTYKNRLSRHRYTVRVVQATAQQAQALEKALILKYRPRDNELKYQAYLQLQTPEYKRYAAKLQAQYLATPAEDCPF